MAPRTVIANSSDMARLSGPAGQRCEVQWSTVVREAGAGVVERDRAVRLCTVVTAGAEERGEREHRGVASPGRFDAGAECGQIDGVLPVADLLQHEEAVA